MKAWLTTMLLGLFVTNTISAATSSKLNIVLDTSGSMSRYNEDIAESILRIKRHSSEHPKLTENINLFSFTNRTAFVIEGDSGDVFSSIKAVESAGGTEDGLIAIEKILSDPLITDTHIILFTDEGRDIVKEIAVENLITLALQRNITIHSVLTTNNFCKSPLIIGTNSMFSGYSIDRSWLKCSDINSMNSLNSFISVKNDDYINLTLSTGGNVWSMTNIFGIGGSLDHKKSPYTPSQQKINARKDAAIDSFTNFIANEMYSTYETHLRADVNIAGEIAVGNIITIDVSHVIVKEGFDPVESWEWDVNNDGTIDDYGSIINFEFTDLEDRFITLWMTSQNQGQVIKEKQIIEFHQYL
ncbi:vWA domain-containing protein [uncultured Paraglaciecola sp.]|uniref:vWA domain-containing protein n=1 Tax=uncultured Paraglaciecola sp. TaxID=1765024 RepID=UPI002591ABC6|nr:vWA domain-containing protein [uncultured Paraglaciecola sp.]